jgi:hypothetical protein
MGCETSFSALHATFSLNHEPVSAASKQAVMKQASPIIEAISI